MKHSSASPLLPSARLFSALAALGLVSAVAIEVEDVFTFAPKPGKEVTRTFSEATHLELESVSMEFGGEARPMDDLEIKLDHGRAVTVKDVYGDSENGVPRSLRRTFEDVSSTIVLDLVDPEGDTEAADIEGEHGLTGMTVAFVWNDEAGVAEPSFDEDAAGDADLLEGLRIDMDLVGLLAPDAATGAEKGARWDVEPAAFLELTRPGGLVDVPFEAEEDEADVGLFLTCLLSCRDSLEEPEGEVEVFWKSTREVDGVLCAVGDLDVDISGTADLTERLLGSISDQLPGIVEEVDFLDTASATVELSGEGEFVWNLAENCLHSVSIELQNTTTLSIEGSVDDGPGDVGLTLVLMGESSFEVGTE